MLATLGADELIELEEMYRLEPFGERAMQSMIAQHSALLLAVNGVKDARAEDFMPRIIDAEPEMSPDEKLKMKFMSMAHDHNAKLAPKK